MNAGFRFCIQPFLLFDPITQYNQQEHSETHSTDVAIKMKEDSQCLTYELTCDEAG
jgi:hypothetical protein